MRIKTTRENNIPGMLTNSIIHCKNLKHIFQVYIAALVYGYR